MRLESGKLLGVFIFTALALHGQEPVCNLFKDLRAADGRPFIVTGELIVSKDFMAIGANDCDYEYISRQHVWPRALRMRASAMVPAEQLARVRGAAKEADRLRHDGKTTRASASLTGRVHLAESGDLPGEFVFDSLNDLKLEPLPDAAELPVVPICDLFQDLTAWKGQRIAVRGEVVGTFEGSWLVGRCKGGFYTDGYGWPVSLSFAGPAYYSSSIEPLIRVKEPSTPPKGFAEFRGRQNIIRSATYIGRLRMRDKYVAVCREAGDYVSNGFGHLGGAAAEIVVEEIRDVELTKAPPEPEVDEERSCQPPNLSASCTAAILSRAAALGCTARLVELLAKDGIDSKDGNESAALNAAIRSGNTELVKVLLAAGAPVNPSKFRNWPPLGEAAWSHKLDVMKALLMAGANVDAVDHQGTTYLAGYGYSHPSVLKILLDAGANPNAIDEDGQTALMHASNYGYEDAVVLLIEHGAVVDQKDNQGRTALMHTAGGMYVDAIPHLLSHGADVYARDLDGKRLWKSPALPRTRLR